MPLHGGKRLDGATWLPHRSNAASRNAGAFRDTQQTRVVVARAAGMSRNNANKPTSEVEAGGEPQECQRCPGEGQMSLVET